MQASVVKILFIGCFVCVSTRHVDVTTDSNITGMRIIDGVCLNVRTDRLVYRFKNDSYVYIAFDTLKTGMVDVFSWTIVNSEFKNFCLI